MTGPATATWKATSAGPATSYDRVLATRMAAIVGQPYSERTLLVWR
ncbi:hypothetical protein ACFQ1L_28800 [Phytohabitans flavus]